VDGALVIENDPARDARRLGQWLREAGLALTTVRPHAGEPVPEGVDGYAAVVVLGGGEPTESWFPDARGRLRRAGRTRTPTLALGQGAELLATATGGELAAAQAGPARGPALVARRDAAEADPIFARVPFTPDVIQWHDQEITELPAGAVLLAASVRYPHQAFRVGPCAWGLHFHIETEPAMLADWAGPADPDTAQRLVAAAAAIDEELAEAWQPFAARFAALASDPDAPPGYPQLPLLAGGR
jgi:GMP synthase-like glutamine amidotransferase